VTRGAALGLSYHEHYRDRPKRAVLADLIRDVFTLDLDGFPAFGGWEQPAIGGWDPSYTPFSYFDRDGLCAANASVTGLPMLLGGRHLDALGLQTVAVRPPWRGHGLCRDLVERALQWCAERSELVLLTTAIPALYERFGFRVLAQHRFAGPAPSPRGGGGRRRLDRSDAGDIRLLCRLLAGRAAVSERFAMLGLGTMFMLNWARTPAFILHHLPEWDAVVATADGEGGALRLHDVVGREIPPLATILGALGAAPVRVEVCFPTDRLGWTGTAEPVRSKDVLMALGPFLGPDEPFTLPPTLDF
jgi:GNAT superfamily N-acetyltransferase